MIASSHKIVRIFIVLLIGPGFLVSAQQLPSVDVDTAQTQIDQFTLENRLLQERIDNLTLTNEELTVGLEQWGTWISSIETVSQRLVGHADQLIEILAELASKTVIERAQEVLNRFYRLEAVLDDKHLELSERSLAANSSIERNTQAVEDLKVKIQSNLENIELLKAAVERSQGSESVVKSYIDNLEKAIEDAEGVLQFP